MSAFNDMLRALSGVTTLRTDHRGSIVAADQHQSADPGTDDQQPDDQLRHAEGSGDGGRGNDDAHRVEPTRSLNDLIREAHGF